ncbi:hypothetical protein HPB50_005634 [Hyalomma asiaticum]|uniref:Uncharacterized protein n=1 Tax=Hyalomma asiaticum TaxID=266040 RepID=A0ACB7TF39_HYAAI|nr:hypothetical protein HPB50_005634 [Hyalomma asiaticum]
MPPTQHNQPAEHQGGVSPSKLPKPSAAAGCWHHQVCETGYRKWLVQRWLVAMEHRKEESVLDAMHMIASS